MNLCIDKNMIDKDEYPQSAAIEDKCVNIIADLWHSPAAKNTYGCSTIGSSEAAMLGGLALKMAWVAKRKKAGKPYNKPNLVCGPVQVCWQKFCRYFDVEIREVPMEKNRLILDDKVFLKYLDENTIGVVPTFGVTYTGQYEPVEAIAKALDAYQKKTGLDIPIHVDGASGGFIAPFVEPNLKWDFRIPRVKSINASGHKFGLAPLGVGWVVWRDKAAMPENMIFWVNYLGSQQATFALNFSRPAGQIIAQYYNFLRLGREGYKKIHTACYDVCDYTMKALNKFNLFKFIYNGKGGIPALTWTFKDGVESKLPFSLFDLSDKMRSFGWLVPAYSMAPNATDLIVMRILVKRGFSKDLADLFIRDMQMSIDHLTNNPMKKKGSKSIQSFNHIGK